MKTKFISSAILLLAVSVGQIHAHEEQQEQIDYLREQVHMMIYENEIKFHHRHTPELCMSRESLEHYINGYKALFFDSDRKSFVIGGKHHSEAFRLAESRTKSMEDDMIKHVRICGED